MQSQKMPTNPELIAADIALRRAALTAKKLAEQQGVPYVVNTPTDRTPTDITPPHNTDQKVK